MNELTDLQELLEKTRTEVAKVVIRCEPAVNLALIAILTGQHALIEGVPGIAKTLLVRTLASALDCEFARIQFTPDLMPADIIGTNVFNLQRNEFTLVKGPVFTTFLMADEINRAPAKTQSALLQAMQERRVTIDRETYLLPGNFTVFATQNPIEFEGTYPLPEAQKDRFMLKISMGHPSRDAELDLARRMLGEDTPENTLDRGEVKPVVMQDQLRMVRKAFEKITLREELINYIVEIVRKTRTDDSILVGASPRATQAFILASRVNAAIEGRDFVTPDDVKALALPVLEHRLILRPEYEIEGLTVGEVVQRVLQEVAVPR
ncbi:MAG: MoxR family ATPase [Candidatus Hydrogenedentes bacterium]|nr:MoxR family ATPase [Candidatus Hydrogenedentota bacterium]